MPSPAAAAAATNAGKGTGLPVPRFVSLRSDKVHLRTGPGTQYPIEWIYHRKTLPVEIIAEYQVWRRIRDWDGDEGWVHQSMLTGTRTVMVTEAARTLRAEPSVNAVPVARLEVGVVGTLKECGRDSGWCQVIVGDYGGWLRRVDIWGVRRDEVYP